MGGLSYGVAVARTPRSKKFTTTVAKMCPVAADGGRSHSSALAVSEEAFF